MLNSRDLDPVREAAGDGALDYVLVLTSFHFINRVADLLNVSPEFLPESLRRFEFLRRLSILIFSMLLSKMDLANREYPFSFEEVIADLTPVFESAMGKKPGNEFDTLKNRPKLIETIKMLLEERDRFSSIDRDTLIKIHRVVESSLPSDLTETEGFHERPADPVEAFAFVGTRYANRTTKGMINDLKGEGYDDTGILDLAIAVADANQWARMYRLLDLDERIFYMSSGK